jgi:hypothetical protein
MFNFNWYPGFDMPKEPQPRITKKYDKIVNGRNKKKKSKKGSKRK